MASTVAATGQVHDLTNAGNTAVELQRRLADDAPDHAWLVKFTAPWCGHCKRVAPVFDELARHVQDRGEIDARVGDVNCVRNQALCQALGVRGYPTILFFDAQGGSPQPYQLHRTVPQFYEFMIQRSPRAIAPSLAPLTRWGCIDSGSTAPFRVHCPQLTSVFDVVADNEMANGWRQVINELYAKWDAAHLHVHLPTDAATAADELETAIVGGGVVVELMLTTTIEEGAIKPES